MNRSLSKKSQLISIIFALTSALLIISCSKGNNITNAIDFSTNNSAGSVQQSSVQQSSVQLKYDWVYGMLKEDGTLWMWGKNTSGTLGNGAYTDSDVPQQVLNLKKVVSFDTNSGLAVAADENGDVWLWGNALFWSVAHRGISTPVKISHLDNVKSIKIGAPYNLYMLGKDGNTYYVKIADANPSQYNQPVKRNDLTNVCSISEAMALLNNGTIVETYPITNSLQGGYVSGISDVKQMQNVYNRRTVVLKNDGTVWAWGQNTIGELGDGTYVSKDHAVQVKGLCDIKAISANYDYNLALKNDGTVWFWGFRYKDSSGAFHSINVPIKLDITDVVSISAGWENMLMKSDGSLYIYNAESQTIRKVQ